MILIIRKIIYYENFSECESSEVIQCVAYTTNVDFDKSKKNTYYDLKIKKFGTLYSDKKNKTIPLDENVLYRFFEGKYIPVT